MTAKILQFPKQKTVHKTGAVGPSCHMTDTFKNASVQQQLRMAQLVVNLKILYWHKLNANQQSIVLIADELAMQGCVVPTTLRFLENLFYNLKNENFLNRFRRWFCRDLRKKQ